MQSLQLGIDSPGQINWQKVRKSSKIGYDQKTLISAFANVLTAKNLELISANETGHRSVSPPNFYDFCNLFQFPKILSLKSFGSSFGNL